MNILRQELKMLFRSWLYFTISIVATITIFVSFFDFFKNDAARMNELMQNLPKEFRAAFGLADVNLADPNGFISFVLTYAVLIGAVYGMKLGVSLLSEETRAKTADFLLSKPVRRIQVVTSKLLAALILISAQYVAIFTLGLASVRLIIKDGADAGIFALLSFVTFLVQLFFIGIGMAIAAALKKIKSVMPVTLGVVFFFFIIEMVNQSLLEKGLTFVTPFSYFKGSYILANRGYDTIYLIIDLTVFVVFTLLSYWIYQKKDVHAV
jgi:ABC-2 type transport system permease protein